MSVKVNLEPSNPNQLEIGNEAEGNFNELLPNEIAQKIFLNLKDLDLETCRKVCKKWNFISNDEYFLKTRYYASEVFGDEHWKKLIGDPGKVTPLPHSIDELLESPCPIHAGKKIKDTHFLFFKPKYINGQPNTINNIGKLIPIGENKTGYDCIWEHITDKHGDIPVEEGEWLLMTNDVLPESIDKGYPVQQELVKNLSTKANAVYQIPKLIDAITGNFAKYVSSGEFLFTSIICSRCQEKSSIGTPFAVGAFSKKGLLVGFGGRNGIGIAALRKL